MKGKIAELKGHFILCGHGQVGQEIARTFKEEGVPFVVVDNRSESIAQVEQAGYLYVPGDATSDEVLKEAGIERARAWYRRWTVMPKIPILFCRPGS